MSFHRNKLYSQPSEEEIEMGFNLQLVDPDYKNDKQQNTSNNSRQTTTQSMENAQLYTYYEDLIKQYTARNPGACDKLALSLIMCRGNRATVSKTRDLELLDIDKMMSLQHKTLKEKSSRMDNMKLAADMSGLKNNLLNRNQPETTPPEATGPNRNFQIFRLIRAAQNHYFGQPPQPTGDLNTDMVINSSENIEEE